MHIHSEVLREILYPGAHINGSKKKTGRAFSSFTWLRCRYFQYNHPFRHYILTDGFSPVRRARSILTIPEVLTKSHIVVFIRSLLYSLSHCPRPVIIALHSPLVDSD